MENKNRLIMNIRAEYCIVCVLLLYLFFVPYIPLRGYFDDLAAVVLFIPSLVGVIQKKYTKTETNIIIALLLVCVIGLISNLFSSLVQNVGYILNDVFSFLRIFLVYFGMVALLRGKSEALDYSIRRLGMYAKAFILIAFVLGIMNFLGIVRMFSTVRFGFKNYYFYFGNASQFGIFAGCALAFLLFRERNNKFYEFMAIVCMVMTFKGMGLIIAVVYSVLIYIANKRIKWWHYAGLLIVLAVLLRYQISAYILDPSAPRAILIYYGFVTAFRYFPLGSGFAAYGSNMAAVHYSQLYLDYGFQYRKALTVFRDGSTYLNDAYLGMIVGQFGLIGLFLMVYVFAKFGKILIRSTIIQNKVQYITIACFCCFCGMAVMAGSIKTAGGQILMAVFAFYQLLSENEKQKKLQHASENTGKTNV